MTATSTTSVDRQLLSDRLRAGTREAHQTAETTGFVTRLMGGELPVAAYTDLAAQHLSIYRTLEQASEQQRSDARGSSVVFAELTRTPSIEADLAHLIGPGWQDQITTLQATQVYAERLAQAGDSLPRYAAHAYTRYLGDLSGGQIIKRMVQRHYGLGEDGVAFYTFADIPKAKVFKDEYRERLDALDLTETELDEAVAEAQLAFELNTALFTELGAKYPKS